MKGPRTAAAAVVMLVLLAPVAAAQGDYLSEHVAFRQEMEELSRNGSLRNPLLFVHLSCADTVAEGNPASDCQPIIRLLVREAGIDQYRLPIQPPHLVVAKARLRIDKQRLKREQGDLPFFAAACQRLRIRDVCDERWSLKKVWTVDPLPADGLRFSVKTSLVRPGVTHHQIGSQTADQIASLQVSAEALGEGALILLWEENGYLMIPVTFSARG